MFTKDKRFEEEIELRDFNTRSRDIAESEVSSSKVSSRGTNLYVDLNITVGIVVI